MFCYIGLKQGSTVGDKGALVIPISEMRTFYSHVIATGLCCDRFVEATTGLQRRNPCGGWSC